MTELLAAALAGGLVVGLVVRVVIHHGYAWRGYQTARRAVPPARRAWWGRFVQLVGVVVALVLVLTALGLAGTPGR